MVNRSMQADQWVAEVDKVENGKRAATRAVLDAKKGVLNMPMPGGNSGIPGTE